MIELDRVSHRYGDHVVLRDLTLTLTQRRIGILGANGSGKSTFARLLNGLIVPTSGTVTVAGYDTRQDGREVRRRVGFMFTDPDSQIVMPTVAEDVAFSLRRSGLGRAEIDLRTQEMLERVGLADRADDPAHLLSGGQKQLLALASVLVRRPEVLVCDEPTTLLDLRNSRLIARLLDDLPQTVIVVTHTADLIRSYDRVLVFDDGQIVIDGPPAEAIAAYEARILGS